MTPLVQLNRSSRDSSDQAVPLADCGRDDEPLVALTIGRTGGIQNALGFQIDHQGVNRALVTAGIQTHGADEIRAGHRSLVDQVGADAGADDGGEHWSRVVGRVSFPA